MTTKLTPEGQRLRNVLVKHMGLTSTKDGLPHTIAALNAAALLLTAPEGDGAGLREALEPFARLEFSFDGFSLDPAELVVLGRCCGRFNPKEHSYLQKAIDAARAALTKQPAAQEPSAAGVVGGDILDTVDLSVRCAFCVTILGERVKNRYCVNCNPPTPRIEPPAAPKTPDAATGGSVGDGGLREALRMARPAVAIKVESYRPWVEKIAGRINPWQATLDAVDNALAQPAPVGEDETGVREALARQAANAFYNIANQLGGYVDTATPEREAAFLLRIEKRAGAYGDEFAALAQPPKAETPAGVGDRTDWIKHGALTEMADAAFAVHVTAPSEAQMDRLHTAAERLLDLRAAPSTAPAARPRDEVSGFVLVPTKITHAMADDLFRTTWPAPTLVQAQKLWDAALAAAPAAKIERVRHVKRVTDNGARALGLDVEALINGDDNDRHGHTVRPSDSSLYDVKCTRCGGTDASGDQRLDQPCVPAAAPAADGGRA